MANQLIALGIEPVDVARSFGAGRELGRRNRLLDLREQEFASSERRAESAEQRAGETANQNRTKFELEVSEHLLGGVLDLPAEQRPAAFQEARKLAQRAGLDLSQIPEQWDENWGRQAFALVRDRNAKIPAPQTREVNMGDEVVTQQFDPRSGQFVEIARAPRFKAERPTIASEVAPIFAKLRSGQPLTPGEQEALAAYRRMDPTDRLISQILGGGGAQPGDPFATAPAAEEPGIMDSIGNFFGGGDEPAAPPVAAPAVQPQPQAQPQASALPVAEQNRLLEDALAAIEAGADPALVQQRLRERGIDPNRLSR